MEEKVKKFERKPDSAIYSELIKYWSDSKIYNKLNARNNKFTLHDGPVYSNGDIHLGHALNKILKDTINRVMAMSGRGLNFIPGWDCNGLPIESKIEASFKAKGISRKNVPMDEFIEECRNFAEYWIKTQRDSFIELGICGDDNYYTTIQLEYQLGIVEVIHKFAKKNLFYQHLKPITWSCEEETALAEAEIEYNIKESNAIDCLFKIHATDLSVLQNHGYICIWTTTPWSLPSNKAIAYNKDAKYSIIKSSDKHIVVATPLLETFAKRTSIEYELIDEIIGEQLKNTICLYPFSESVKSPLIESDHVTMTDGTGFVHIAPDHGVEDALLGDKYNFGYCCYIKEDGCFRHLPNYLLFLKGQFYSKTETLIIDYLQSMILHVEKIKHSYPHSWRSRKPLIYRATSQWFVDLAKIKKLGVEEAEKVRWTPSFCKDRFISTLSSRESWCCSRQRIWGTPIALFHKDGQILTDQGVLDRTMEYMKKYGIYGWYNVDARDFILQGKYNEYNQINDIIDIWFESGCTQYFILQKLNQYPADMYLEGCDQNKAWFQTSMLVSVGLTEKAPYKQIYTHGYVVDSQGKKMSKSLGNGKSPRDILQEFSPDSLRLWALNQDTSNDIKWSNRQMLDCQIIEYKIRNTLKFLITNSKKHLNTLNYNELSILEQWILNMLYQINELYKSAIEKLSIHTIVHKIYSFCEIELSKLYFDIRKDALYWECDNHKLKIQTESVLDIIFNCIVRWIAPFIPFTAEDAWMSHAHHSESIHLQYFPECDKQWDNPKVADIMKEILIIRDMVNTKVEILRINREIKSSIDCNVVIYAEKAMYDMLNQQTKTIQDILLISNFEFLLREYDIDSNAQYNIEIYKAEGFKCTKCKKIYAEDKYNEQHMLCDRCLKKFIDI